MLTLVLALVVGYLLGSLPFGYLVARAKGVNIFEVGSKNPGATNVRRVLGSGPGNLVFILDALKGATATGLCKFVIAKIVAAPGDLDPNLWAPIAGLVGALVGHSFSCFTKFKGGKGVATASGGFLVLVTYPVLIAALVWTITFYASRYVSLASILAAIVVPVATFFFRYPSPVLGLTALIGVFVVIRHRSNIQRLLNGTESKFVKKPAQPQSAKS